MSTNPEGSTWKKWDLHVHTPESLVHSYPGQKEVAWEAFLKDLEQLPTEFKVIGINDYLFVDGYERVLRAKRQEGRLANIDLILPVLELRLDKFGGVVQKGPGGYVASGWSRINVHVIFDQVEPELIRQQFISAIAPSYTLTPDSQNSVKWSGVITRDSLQALGEAIIHSTPEDRRAAFGPALLEGFNNLNVGWEGLRRALDNQMLGGKFLVAIGKTEWDNLKWDDHTIAEKKTLINEADLVFTASENPAAYARARARLIEASVNSILLDCSDAHSLSTGASKDRIGNCFTWIKADSTFSGLQQALREFDNRVFVGEKPPKLQVVERHRTKFIKSIEIRKVPNSSLAEPWFDVDIPLNANLVAIIGNKGSGKSALSDILALAGNTKNFDRFSFLTDGRFRSPRAKFAHHFLGKLTWLDGSETSRLLDQNPDPSNVERVKYLPQRYLEELCNELGEGGSATFDAELRKIIYSHVPEADKLGFASMDELLKFKVAEFGEARQAARHELGKLNAQIVEAERRSTPEFKRSLEESLSTRRQELAALDGEKPEDVEDPSASPEALDEHSDATAKLKELENALIELTTAEDRLRESKTVATRRIAVANRVLQALDNHRKHHDTFVSDLGLLLAELDDTIPVAAVVTLQIDLTPIEAVAASLREDLSEAERRLQDSGPDSIASQRDALKTSITETKGRLGERQRRFVRYKEEFAQWLQSRQHIVGTRDSYGSIAWLEGEIEALAQLPAKLVELRNARKAVARGIHDIVRAMENEYQRLYEPVQAFVKSAEQMDMTLPLAFKVRIEESGFRDQFVGRLNRQARGSFAGVEESEHRLRTLLQQVDFNSAAAAVEFAESIDDLLHHDRRDANNIRETKLAAQLRKGVEPVEVLDHLYGFEYLSPRYSLTYDGQDMGQLSPGERGLLLLIFYLLVDKDDIPIVIDQPEENLDNQTIYKVLVKCIKRAKEIRQVVVVTHNPNLAVVCDAEQLIYASCDKKCGKFSYESGAMENPSIRAKVVEILEGTEPAFRNRQYKYRLV